MSDLAEYADGTDDARSGVVDMLDGAMTMVDAEAGLLKPLACSVATE